MPTEAFHARTWQSRFNWATPCRQRLVYADLPSCVCELRKPFRAPPLQLSAFQRSAARGRRTREIGFWAATAVLAGTVFAGVLTWPTPRLVAHPDPGVVAAPVANVYYAGCNEARAAGAAPLYHGQPGYRPEMDGDDDGIACEPHHDDW